MTTLTKRIARGTDTRAIILKYICYPINVNMGILYLATARSVALIALLSLPAVHSQVCGPSITCTALGWPGYCCSQYGVSPFIKWLGKRTVVFMCLIFFSEYLRACPLVLWNYCRLLWSRLSEWAMHQRTDSTAPISAAAPSPHRLQLQRQSRRGFASYRIRGQLADLPRRRPI